MTGTETTRDRAGVEAALTAVHGAIDGLTLDGFTPIDLAQALLELSVTAAEKSIGRAGVANQLVSMAEGLLRIGAPAAAPSPTAFALEVLADAVGALRAAGQTDAMIRHHMLAYVAGWFGNAEGQGGAEVLYRYADAIVGRSGAPCH